MGFPLWHQKKKAGVIPGFFVNKSINNNLVNEFLHSLLVNGFK